MNDSTRRMSQRVTRRGVVAPLVAILLPVLLLLLGFSVDLAHMQKARSELRVATDNAARAAAAALARTDSFQQARNAAKGVALANTVAGKGLELADEDIGFGRSLRQGNKYIFQAGMTPANSVKVSSKRTAKSLGGSVSLFFGSLLGKSDFEPEADAVASFLNVDICLVLDRSTSMKVDASSDEEGLYTNDSRYCQPPGYDTRWVALDGAVRDFTKILRKSNAVEHVAVVTYSSDITGTVFESVCGQPYRTTFASTLDVPLTSSMDTIDAVINDLTNALWNGNTDIESGMRTGLAELLANSRPTSDMKLIVLTDGNENIGSSAAAAKDCAAADVQVHTITFGDFADQATMKAVADIGGGAFQHAKDAKTLRKAFRKLAGELTRVTE